MNLPDHDERVSIRGARIARDLEKEWKETQRREAEKLKQQKMWTVSADSTCHALSAMIYAAIERGSNSCSLAIRSKMKEPVVPNDEDQFIADYIIVEINKHPDYKASVASWSKPVTHHHGPDKGCLEYQVIEYHFGIQVVWK